MAAGLGFKDFTTGEVLTAADVDGYLMQGVWVFADAAARTAAVTSPQEGNMSFLKDTNSTEYYSGSAWVAIGGSVPTSLEFTAGKNKIINGDFRINQRNFSTITTGQGYGFDRWNHSTNGGTITYSTQNFTAGAAPVAGYEGTTFARMDVAGGASAGDYCLLQQKIEDVRTFAGQTVTVSLWAKSDTAGDKLGIELFQDFGSGGSSDTGAAGQSVTLTTSWARYSVTIANPSISGKTIGTSSLLEMNLWVTAGTSFNTRSGTVGVQTAVIDVWGVQVEAGSTATSFQTATGTIQGELAACQRYYYRNTPTTAYGDHGLGTARSTTQVDFCINFPVQMRVAPGTLDTGNVSLQIPGVSNTTLTNLVIDQSGVTTCVLQGTVASGLTQFRVYHLANNNNTAGFVGFSSEL
jgi:hypothetical protein